MPALLLVNGLTITQAEAAERVEYFHLEFEGHEIIVAEGAPAESYVESNNRRGFHNAAEFYALYPEDDRPSFAECAPRLATGMPALGEIRQRLSDRAATLGHRTTDDPGLYLIADGAAIYPSAVEHDVYRFVLAQKPAMVTLASRSSVPAEIEALSTDTRRLGVSIAHVTLHGENLRVDVGTDYPGLGLGFHEDEGGWRWTDGRGVLPAALFVPFRGRITIEVKRVPARLRYALRAVAAAAQTADPDLHLVADGAMVPPLAAEGSIYRFALAETPSDLRLISRSAIPAELDPVLTDTRRLGVCLDRISLRGGGRSFEVLSPNARLSGGFHQNEGGHRWTDGRAALPARILSLFTGPLDIVVELCPNKHRYELADETRPAGSACLDAAAA